MNNLWKSGTQKAFYGYAGQLLIGIVGGFILGLMEPDLVELAMGEGTGYYVMSIIVGIASVAAWAYYFIGIKEMKEAAANTNMAAGTNRLYVACLILLGAAALGLCLDFFSDLESILVALVLIGIAELVGFILTWTGYAMVKNSATDANAKSGAELLCTSALITVIAAAIGLIPVLWWLALIGEIAALYYAFQGWKTLANSDLE